MLSAEDRRRSLIERLGHIDELLQSLESAPERLTDGSQRLLRAMRILLTATDGALDQRWRALEGVPIPLRDRLRRELCDDFHDVLEEFGYTLVPALEGASASSIPVELEATVQTGVHNAAAAWQLGSVLYGVHEYNYSVAYIEDPVQQFAPRLGNVPPAQWDAETEGDFAFLSLPKLERRSISLHAIVVGHELGHLRDWYEGISDGLELKIPDAFFEEGGQLSTEAAPKLQLYETVAGAWVSEVVADVIAYLVLGPAAILSLAELTSTLGPMDVDSLTHPGSDRRLRIMLDVSQRRGATGLKEMDNALDELRVFGDPLSRPVQVRGIQDQATCQRAWDWLRATLGEIISSCEDAIEVGQSFTPELAEDVARAADLLARGRPCGELLHPDVGARTTRTRVILNAVWLVKAGRLADLADYLSVGVDSGRDIHRLSSILEDLTAKSLEIAARQRGRV